MHKQSQSHLLKLLLAVMLPSLTIGSALWSCSQDLPPVFEEENQQTSQTKPFSLLRTPGEAIDIATRGYEEFYGGETILSRSGRSIVDLRRPVEVIRGLSSRGTGESDTLLYVINFVDDNGFAVVSASRLGDELLAVTSKGHYYPESDPDAEEVPGFSLWMEDAREYASALINLSSSDSDGSGSVRIDSFITPPFTVDTTKLDPKDPGWLEQKEWEDTIFYNVIEPKLPVAWGQGRYLRKDLTNYPEGYYFDNGYAGCVTIAIAQVCAYYSSPKQFLTTPFMDASLYTLDWSKMRYHKSTIISQEEWGKCRDDIATHKMVADFCKIIGSWTFATPHGESGTSTNTVNILPAVRRLLSDKTVEGWEELNMAPHPVGNTLLMIEGRRQPSGGHVWLCDGAKRIITDHYFATRKNASSQWEIQSVTRGDKNYLRYNWGWYGSCDGWFNNAPTVIVYNSGRSVYKELKYAKIY